MKIEYDSMGAVEVPEDACWGAQTQRSLENFKIGIEKIPLEVIKALAVIKQASAVANCRLGKLDEERRRLILTVCEEIAGGSLDKQFPLAVWQTGSGTQSNMNVNEVIANRGNVLADKKILHPNDHVNMSQSSNDAFPSAMHIASVIQIEDTLLPAVDNLAAVFKRLEEENRGIVKTGRTHLQDATPVGFSQEISGWRVMLEKSGEMIRRTLDGLLELAIGGTAVGTGLNAPPGFDRMAAAEIAGITGKAFRSSDNKFHSLSSKDALVYAHGALKALAANLMKIANDIRWLASGPRCGLGELYIPENEPGSSIMPGKVNPTQCEALTMIAVQVMANDTAVAMAASQGNFQLNVFMPVCIYNFLQSVRLLADGIISFNNHCASGIRVNREKMAFNLRNSLMNVTALTPYIGYDNAAMVAKKAYAEHISLEEAVLSLRLMDKAHFEEVFHPEKMI
jgi:fumarate hydratase class II